MERLQRDKIGNIIEETSANSPTLMNRSIKPQGKNSVSFSPFLVADSSTSYQPQPVVKNISCLSNNSFSVTESSTPINELQSPYFQTIDISDDEYLPSLVVEVTKKVPAEPFPSNRVICDVEHLIHQARESEKHSIKCKFGGQMVLQKFNQRGLVFTFNFVCNMPQCKFSLPVMTDREYGKLNQIAVLGCMATGSGFSLEEQKFSLMNMSYMSQNTYALCEKSAGEHIQQCTEEELAQSIAEEKKLAEERGDVDSDGYHNICVIVDGGWCKRSYGHGYNSSSGIAVIIGAFTQKNLYINVRNKICLICQSIENGKSPNKEHACNKNWSGPSTAMEADIIITGMKRLESKHNIRCTRLIGDGDTNLMTQVQQNVSYGGRVLKIECANHAVRRYCNSLERLRKNTSRFPGSKGVQCRKVLHERMFRLTSGVRVAIKNHALKNLNEPSQMEIDALVIDILNIPAHVFGNHEHCGSFCQRKNLDSAPCVFKIMQEGEMLSAVMDETKRVLVSCCNTLIFDLTNNPAETYMSQLCKTIGGKRIDFSKGRSIERRANLAALAFQQPAQKWQHSAHKAVTGMSPKTPHKNFLVRRNKRHARNLKRKILFPNVRNRKMKQRQQNYIGRGGDKHYGDEPDVPDLDAEAIRIRTEVHLKSISVKSRWELECQTRTQANSEIWRHERSKRIPSTMFKDVAGRRKTTLCSKLVKRIIYRDVIYTKAMEYGKANEAVALKEYTQRNGECVQRCGMFICPLKPFLCSSPDGLIDLDGLIEIKCPYSAKDSNSFSEVCDKHAIGLKKNVDGSFYLPKTHSYYFQIQGQLAISDRKWCDLFFWSPKESLTLRIERDEDFWQGIVPKLESFYMQCCVPELNDRVPRKKPIRKSQYILDAIASKTVCSQRKEPKKTLTKTKKSKQATSVQPSVSNNEEAVIQDLCVQTENQEQNDLSMNKEPNSPPANEAESNSTWANCDNKSDNLPSPPRKRIRKPKMIFDL